MVLPDGSHHRATYKGLVGAEGGVYQTSNPTGTPPYLSSRDQSPKSSLNYAPEGKRIISVRLTSSKRYLLLRERTREANSQLPTRNDLGFNRGNMIESYLDKTPQIAPEAYVHQSAVVIGDVHLADNASIWPNATLRGDDGTIEVGQSANIQDGTVVHSTQGLSVVTVGEQTTIGHNATIHGAKIGANCLIGMGSIILDNAQIGDWSLIGAGSLVTQNTVIPPRSFVLGSPAKVVRTISDREVVWITYSWKHYVQRSRDYRGK